MQDAVTVQQDANRTEVKRVSSTSAASPFVQAAGIGVDIGSTWAKAVAVDGAGTLIASVCLPTGWSSKEALKAIQQALAEQGVLVDEAPLVATGYGREAVANAAKRVTEITCHARGAAALFPEETLTIIDIGGQDTKVIACRDGRVEEFYMNDKCSAGTGRFLEIMAQRLDVSVGELDHIARTHTEELSISAMCTVFAESEVISLIGGGASKENIAWGVLQSVVKKVSQEFAKLSEVQGQVVLTGGLCDSAYFIELVANALGRTVVSSPEARLAGAYGAALIAKDLKQK